MALLLTEEGMMNKEDVVDGTEEGCWKHKKFHDGLRRDVDTQFYCGSSWVPHSAKLPKTGLELVLLSAMCRRRDGCCGAINVGLARRGVGVDVLNCRRRRIAQIRC